MQKILIDLKTVWCVNWLNLDATFYNAQTIIIFISDHVNQSKSSANLVVNDPCHQLLMLLSKCSSTHLPCTTQSPIKCISNTYIINIVTYIYTEIVNYKSPHNKHWSLSFTSILVAMNGLSVSLLAAIAAIAVLQYFWKRRRIYALSMRLNGSYGNPILGHALQFIDATSNVNYWCIWLDFVNSDVVHICRGRRQYASACDAVRKFVANLAGTSFVCVHRQSGARWGDIKFARVHREGQVVSLHRLYHWQRTDLYGQWGRGSQLDYLIGLF